jgi:hypothetical protein
MSPDPVQALPPHWKAFLKEVDGRLDTPVELHCLGGFVLATAHGLPRPTGDVDYIAAIPSDTLADLERIAGLGSALAKSMRSWPLAPITERVGARHAVPGVATCSRQDGNSTLQVSTSPISDRSSPL